MFKRIISICTILLFFGFNVKADNPDIKGYINNLLESTFAILDNNALSLEAKKIKSKELISNNLDFTWMTQYALGRNQISLSQEQKAKFATVYSKYLTNSYAQIITLYKSQKIDIKNIVNLPNNEFAVNTIIVDKLKNANDNTKVVYMVRQTDSGFKIFDILTDGISLLKAQKSTFTDTLKKNDGFNVLVKDLEAKSNT